MFPVTDQDSTSATGDPSSLPTLSVADQDSTSATGDPSPLLTLSVADQDSTSATGDPSPLPILPVADQDTTGSDSPLVLSYLHFALEEHDGGLKTSLGNSMEKLLRFDTDLADFDELRFTIKESRKRKKRGNMTEQIAKYQILAARLGAEIKSKQSELNKKLKHIEHQHLQAFNKLPTKATNKHYPRVLKLRNIATTILRNLY